MIPVNQYLSVFKASPIPSLILLPDKKDFIIADVNDALVKAINVPEEFLKGKLFYNDLAKYRLDYFFEIQSLRKSLDHVIISKAKYSPSDAYFVSGNYAVELAPSLNASGEIDHVIVSFVQKKKAVTSPEGYEQKIEKLLQKLDQYRSIFSHSPYGICRFDLEGNFLTANARLAQIAECDLEDLYNNQFEPFIAPEDREMVFDRFNKAAAGEMQKYECNAVTAKNKKLIISIINMPVIVNEEIIGVYGIVNDITEERKAEQRLKELNEQLNLRAAELTALNKELEQFAYVASHDLREPLRMVSAFMDLLKRKYGEDLDDDANTYIDYAIDGSKRMQQLIRDLLQYSRTGREESEKQWVGFSEIVEEAKLNLLKQIEDNNAKIIVEAVLPELKVDRSAILRLFQNLINNAIKFRKKDADPVVTINAREEENHWIFEISDSGVGISKKDYQKIFEVFSRLHTRDEYPGSGIGLAVCKKIVDQHSGEIWVESEPGEGSTFYFSIAKE